MADIELIIEKIKSEMNTYLFLHRIATTALRKVSPNNLIEAMSKERTFPEIRKECEIFRAELRRLGISKIPENDAVLYEEIMKKMI